MLERKNQYIFQDDNFWSGAAIGSQLVIEISEEFCQKSSSFLKEKKNIKKMSFITQIQLDKFYLPALSVYAIAVERNCVSKMTC